MILTPRLLVVDDEPLLVNLTRYLLEHAGFEVATAGNGAEALALVRAQPFELVLSDLMMPVMDGKALLSAIQREPDPPPVVILTGYGDEADPVLRANGAREVLGKPISPAALIAAVHRHARPRA
jgi:two-component system alkaline phosphatase synthesis response regulator PhoP